MARAEVLGFMRMEARGPLPDYYRERYVSWYGWFSPFYDLFVRLMLFVLNGGFGGEKRLRDTVIDLLAPRPGERIIDICSGTGTLSILLGMRLSGSGQVAGIEISDHQLAVARRKPAPRNVAFTRADAQATPFPESHFDRGVIFGALHEMPRPVRRRILAEARRVIKPGGRIVLLEHNRPARRWLAWLYRLLEWPTPEYSTYRDLLQSGLINEISEAGFRIMQTEVVASQFFQVVVAERS
jgi:ubiquinone/menaquinone biosynthesis C-methylase UbiE